MAERQRIAMLNCLPMHSIHRHNDPVVENESREPAGILRHNQYVPGIYLTYIFAIKTLTKVLYEHSRFNLLVTPVRI